jgi:hypothetical protein
MAPNFSMTYVDTGFDFRKREKPSQEAGHPNCPPLPTMIGAVAREGRQRVENLRRQRELRPQRQLYQICANRQLFQRHPATSTWAFLCAKLLKELKFQSRIGGLDHVRDVGVAGSNPVTPIK